MHAKDGDPGRLTRAVWDGWRKRFEFGGASRERVKAEADKGEGRCLGAAVTGGGRSDSDFCHPHQWSRSG